jgi:hypothetical protein
MNFFFYISLYFLFLFSLIGYGTLIKSICFKNNSIDFGYLGIFGILFLTILAYIINFVSPISLIITSLTLTIGVILFSIFLKKKYIILKKDSLILIYIFIFLIPFILVAKNHDDFPYYHFAYINIITNLENFFGLGNFNHGFRTPSSIFYFSSFLYLPGTNYNLIHITPVFFLGFVNFILLKKIIINFEFKKNFYVILLSILSLALINIFFYRMSEHGTDRSAQIIILLLFIESIELLNKKYLDKDLFKKIIVLITLAVSLKAFYLLYIFLFLPLLVFQKKKLSLIINLLSSKIFYICFLFFLILIFINFMNTGCFIYPLKISCNENFIWSISLSEVSLMNEWYQLWSKAGAKPGYAIDDRSIYISNFNWLGNWLDNYFFNKVSDFLLGLVFLILIIFGLFFNRKLNFKFFFKKKIIFLYFILILFFIEWFYNHPALRYGGYHLIALLIFIPFALFLDNKVNFDKKLYIRIIAILAIILIIFLTKNVIRIGKEIKLYHYNILYNVSYNEEFKNYDILNRILMIKDCNEDLCTKEAIKYDTINFKGVFYKEKKINIDLMGLK